MVGGKDEQGRVGGGDNEQGRIGGGDNKWWEAKLSKGDDWGEVTGGGRQNQVGGE